MNDQNTEQTVAETINPAQDEVSFDNESDVLRAPVKKKPQALLEIRYGVGTMSDQGRVFTTSPEIVDKAQEEKILARDDHTCRFCRFKADKYQAIVFLGENPKKAKEDEYVTACSWCHQCFHLNQIPVTQSGALIWLPELTQAELNNIARAIYIARITQGPIADTARDVLELLMARKAEAKNRLGTDNPKTLVTIFEDFMEPKEYAMRNRRLQGFRILPLDRRVVREGELEFNQFPQMLAYWRSSNGPFGQVPPRSWPEMFYNLKARLNPDT